MNPELAVIIPTYKRNDSLKKLLQILFDQQNISIEIIVVDQNPDNYFDNPMRDLLNRVKWIKQSIPNASDARNRGFLSAAAPCLLFIDDDLVPESDFCRKGLDVFLTYTGIDCFVPLVYSYEGEAAAVKWAKNKYLEDFTANREIFSISDTISAAVFFRKDFFFKTGGFDDLLFEFAKTAEDQEFFLRMQKKGMKLWFVPSVKIFHDEKIPGGCDLRTDDYWVTREKCIRAWALRYRTKSGKGIVGFSDFIRLFRSCVINLEVLRSSPVYIARQFSLMRKALRESGAFFEKRSQAYIARLNNGFLTTK